ncbi:MAG: hypothetical protein KGO51_08500 [Alphaproteobacteria bacterium]|nr:hypothetical protein [Alphaproteobacteria bacterium]
MRRLSGALAGAFLAAAACAARAGPLAPGQSEGLGLLPRAVPGELKKAEADPYALPPAPVCASIDHELGALEKVLGPDVDAVQPKSNKAVQLIGGAVRSAIPYRGWIRKITGAEHADHERDKAMLAGWERRGYLKGLARQKRCLLRRGAVVTAAEQGVPASAEAPAGDDPAGPPQVLPPAVPADAAEPAPPRYEPDEDAAPPPGG